MRAHFHISIPIQRRWVTHYKRLPTEIVSYQPSFLTQQPQPSFGLKKITQCYTVLGLLVEKLSKLVRV